MPVHGELQRFLIRFSKRVESFSAIFSATSKILQVTFDSYLFQETQKEREAQLKTLLLERIDPYVQDKREQFTTWAQDESHQLAEAGEFMSNQTKVRRLIFFSVDLLLLLVL